MACDRVRRCCCTGLLYSNFIRWLVLIRYGSQDHKPEPSQRAAGEQGVPNIRVHDTQHTCASLLAALDVHPRVAMRIMRRSQISMTMDVYTQIPTPETRAALDRLNQSLDG
ncbi:hypothetical protein [Streptosporangium minutum]|uniref:Tyr recombinase domain-containing protein n=1 Tax=Streptosporangium minutum TaxID=569862 RepID=A0A243RGB0_9ACTN|nr:hypothetical protein [Streptosporangium minutum]OUC93798.1 hypothetical protein CA984_24900 [Streptosporangium minutum]